MLSILRKALALLLCVQSILVPVLVGSADAAESGRSGESGYSSLRLSEELGTSARGNEYMSGNYPGAVLMPVNLWGAVPKPGIHHVPTQTDLLRLLSYAGGPDRDAELKELTIKRTVGGQDRVIPVDLKKLLTKPGQATFPLEPNDIVHIPKTDEAMSASTLRIITFASLIFSTVLTGLLISDHFKDRTLP